VLVVVVVVVVVMMMVRRGGRRRSGMMQLHRLTVRRVEIGRQVSWRSLISAFDAAPFCPTIVSSAASHCR
jgi:hypothetical protein